MFILCLVLNVGQRGAVQYNDLSVLTVAIKMKRNLKIQFLSLTSCVGGTQWLCVAGNYCVGQCRSRAFTLKNFF